MNAYGEPTRAVFTRRLCLRLPYFQDAEALAHLMSPDISARLASWPVHLTSVAAAARISEARSAALAGLALPMVITRRSNGEVIGWISAARSEADPDRAILTYWLGDSFHGEGVMREAAPAAMEAVFAQLGVNEIRAAVQTDNLASRSVLRGLGMRPLGLGRIWCASRGREETCEWWGVLRPIEADATLMMQQPVGMPMVEAAMAAAVP